MSDMFGWLVAGMFAGFAAILYEERRSHSCPPCTQPHTPSPFYTFNSPTTTTGGNEPWLS